MGIYTRRDSPFYWMLLERPGRAPLKASTKIPKDAPDAMSRKLQRQQADTIYRARMNDLARLRHDLPAIDPVTTTFTAFSTWYETHVLPKHRGHEREREILKPLRAFFGSDDLSAITDARVTEYETHRLTTCKPSTVNREVDVLKRIVAAAVPDYLPHSPIAGRAQLRRVKIQKRVLSPAEEARLLEQLAPDLRALFIVAVDTLARLSNVLHLTRAENKGTHLDLRDSKTGPYAVPLSTRARAALAALPTQGPYYFPQRRVAKTERDRRGAIRMAVKRACARCTPPVPYGRAIGGITFHTGTRASGATRLLQANVDPRTVQAVGNWASLEQMGDYLHTDMRRMKQAVDIGAKLVTSQLRDSERTTKPRKRNNLQA